MSTKNFVMTGPRSAGQFIRNERRKRDLSQKELSEITGVRQATISKIENGNKNARIDTLFKIIKKLGFRFEIAENQTDEDVIDGGVF